MMTGLASIASELMPSTLDVLLVKNNAGDTLMVTEALADSPVQLHAVRDGDEALAFLLHEGEHGYAPRQGLVLLDLNLSRLDGRRVLSRVKTDGTLGTVKRAVYSRSWKCT